MKKFFGVIISILFLVSPMTLRAEEQTKTKIDLSKYNTLNFTETLKDEQIEIIDKDYKETDDQVTIYLFRGKGCGYCRAFLTFLNSISKEYGKYFKVVSFETWYDENNTKLLATMSEFMKEDAGGVPYIIIGDKVFGGYTESYNEDIKSTIKTLYDSTDRYDAIEAYNDSIKFHLSDAATATIWNLIFVSIATFIVIRYVRKSKREIIESLEGKKTTKVETKDEIKDEIKDEDDDYEETPKKVVKKKNVKKKK